MNKEAKKKEPEVNLSKIQLQVLGFAKKRVIDVIGSGIATSVIKASFYQQMRAYKSTKFYIS